MKRIIIWGIFAATILLESCMTHSYTYLSHKGIVNYFDDIPLYEKTLQKLYLDVRVIETDTLDVTFYLTLHQMETENFNIQKATVSFTYKLKNDSEKNYTSEFKDLRPIYFDPQNERARYEAKMDESDFKKWIYQIEGKVSLITKNSTVEFYPETRFLSRMELMKERLRHRL